MATVNEAPLQDDDENDLPGVLSIRSSETAKTKCTGNELKKQLVKDSNPCCPLPFFEYDYARTESLDFVGTRNLEYAPNNHSPNCSHC